MDKKDLLRAMSDIDDKFIEEADIKAKAENRTKKRFRYQKWMAPAAAVLAVVLVCSILPRGAMKSMAPEGEAFEPSNYASDNSMKGITTQYTKSDITKNPDMPEDVSKGDASAALLGEDVKMVYTAQVDAETEDFEKAETEIKNMVAGIGGYIEVQNVGEHYSSQGTYKTGYFVLRVPAESFNAVLEQSSEFMDVTGISQKADNIGTQYHETERRLETLKIKEDRLQELLKKATNLTDIITLENELSQNEYEIESYSNQMNYYDHLLGFSTISINLYETARSGGSILSGNDFGARLSKSFKQGLENFIDGVGNLVIWISYNFLTLIIIAAVLFVLIKFKPIGKLYRKIRKID